MCGDKFLCQWLWHSLAKLCTKKLWKSVNICKSYSKKTSGTFFLGHGVYILCCYNKNQVRQYTDLWQVFHSVCRSSWKTCGEICFKQHEVKNSKNITEQKKVISTNFRKRQHKNQNKKSISALLENSRTIFMTETIKMQWC